MPSKTSNYQLNQWVPEDNFLRADFNEDNAKIDAALAGKCEMVCGTYTGDGEASRTIELGFRPRAVYFCTSNGFTSYNPGSSTLTYGGLVLPDMPLALDGTVGAQITDTGFSLNNTDYVRVNRSNYTYFYIAIR